MLSSNGSGTGAGDGSAGDGLHGQAEEFGTVRQCADPVDICDEDPKQMLAFGSEAFGVERLKCKEEGDFAYGRPSAQHRFLRAVASTSREPAKCSDQTSQRSVRLPA